MLKPPSLALIWSPTGPEQRTSLYPRSDHLHIFRLIISLCSPRRTRTKRHAIPKTNNRVSTPCIPQPIPPSHPKQSSEPAFHIRLPIFFHCWSSPVLFPFTRYTFLLHCLFSLLEGLQLSDQKKVGDFDLHALKDKIK